MSFDMPQTFHYNNANCQHLHSLQLKSPLYRKNMKILRKLKNILGEEDFT